MSQANVYTSVSNQTWYTDRCRITAGSTDVTYQVNMIYATPATGNLFSNPAALPAYSTTDVWVGAGNKLTIAGTTYSAQEIGTTTSGQYAVKGL